MTTPTNILDKKLISQGAEAKVFLATLEGKKVILKQRIKKKYRHPSLEARLSKKRLQNEVKCLQRVMQLNIKVPKIISTNLSEKIITLEYCEGMTFKEYLFKFDVKNRKETIMLFKSLGETIAKMHAENIVHGDLTTSNVVIENNASKETITLIDFGLGKLNANVEDKAVDIYVFERALSSTHPNSSSYFLTFLETYESCERKYPSKNQSKKSSNKETVIERLKKVQLRGRKRTVIG